MTPDRHAAQSPVRMATFAMQIISAEFPDEFLYGCFGALPIFVRRMRFVRRFFSVNLCSLFRFFRKITNTEGQRKSRKYGYRGESRLSGRKFVQCRATDLTMNSADTRIPQPRNGTTARENVQFQPSASSFVSIPQESSRVRRSTRAPGQHRWHQCSSKNGRERRIILPKYSPMPTNGAAIQCVAKSSRVHNLFVSRARSRLGFVIRQMARHNRMRHQALPGANKIGAQHGASSASVKNRRDEPFQIRSVTCSNVHANAVPPPQKNCVFRRVGYGGAFQAEHRAPKPPLCRKTSETP